MINLNKIEGLIMKTSKISFLGYTKIVTKKPIILNALMDFDDIFLRKEVSPACRYGHVAGSGDEKGFFYGVLADGEEAQKAVPNYCPEGIKEVLVSSLEDLKKISVLQKYYSQIASILQKIKPQ